MNDFTYFLHRQHQKCLQRRLYLIYDCQLRSPHGYPCDGATAGAPTNTLLATADLIQLNRGLQAYRNYHFIQNIMCLIPSDRNENLAYLKSNI